MSTQAPTKRRRRKRLKERAAEFRTNLVNKKIKFEDEGDLGTDEVTKEKAGGNTRGGEERHNRDREEGVGTTNLEVGHAGHDEGHDEGHKAGHDEGHRSEKHRKDKQKAKVSYFYESDEETFTIKDQTQNLLSVRQKLPIFQHKDKIIEYIKANQVTVIIGETGSGKSTQIPQFLMPLNKKRIAVTQPRRVAAASLAARVSQENGTPLGQAIGYQVRFSNITSHRTKVAFLTDGMLIRELMLDELLLRYSTVVIDEAHERTVLTDLVLGFLKLLLKKRPDLKLVIMSATLNAELFSRFFQAPILFVEGKMYPVTKHYLSESPEDVVDTMVRAIVQVNMGEEEGDVLCFLPGQEEIDSCVSVLLALSPELPKQAPRIVPLPLYAALSPAQQLRIFETLPKRQRKVILATNVAETSITVSGVKYVIDSGLRKVKVWRHQLGLSTLLTTPISQASAKQRAGRAGRESPGKVFRLYSEKMFGRLPKQDEAEILRNDVILPVLTLKKMNVDDLLNWTWLEHPGQEAVLGALSTLHNLGALNDHGVLTPLGHRMAVLPLPPALSAVLISAQDLGVLGLVMDIVACLSVDNLVINVVNGELRDEINVKRRQYCPKGTRYGDLVALKEYYDHFLELGPAEAKAWCKELFFSYKGFRNVMRVRKQLCDYMDAADADPKVDIEQILKAFLRGFATNTAIGMPDRSFRTCLNGQLISIHPSSCLFGKQGLDAVMYMEYVYTAKAYARSVLAVELAWLQELRILGTRVGIE